MTFGMIFSVAALVMAAVGGIGLLATLSMSIFERQKEIGVMRSIGASSRTVAGQFLVEGILVAYAGYYLPGWLDVYYLEDFRQVQQSLPKVRSTFFFSVPRVFEKAWESLEESRAGRFYLGLEAGPVKNVLRPLLRWTVLGKLGLRMATQLTVGSAVAGEDMLQNFRELGIEIHNAYG